MILDEAKSIQSDLVNMRRHLHMNPEIGMELPQTIAFVKEKLEELGYKVEALGGGLTATVGNGKGKCFLLRADMDALPVREETDLEYKSENCNMHACGHDFHTTMLLGAAKLLKDHENEIEGTVKLMFQPGEETNQGAKSMLDGGILENPHVDGAAMFHVSLGIPLKSGVILVPSGPFTAAADWFEIKIKGKGGHGAMPETAIDPLNVVSHLHLALQEINARELSGDTNAVITVGMIKGGNSANVIPDTALMKGTIRTFDGKVREYIPQRIKAISKSIAEAFRAEAEINILKGSASVICNEKVSSDILSSLREVFGDGVIDQSSIGGMKMNVSEDFSSISQRIPSVMMILSAGSPEEGYTYPQHHPKAHFNENVLYKGAAAYALTAMGWLLKNK